MTPLFQQYKTLKQKYKDHILFFRLGDFYELFEEDATNYHHILQVTLTQRQGIPMCGIPHHARKNYINKLLLSGKSVALAEQVSQNSKQEIIQRDVVRIITPGTIFEEEDLELGNNNFLGALFFKKNCLSISLIDLSTGHVNFTSIENLFVEQLLDILSTYTPKEIILSTKIKEVPLLKQFLQEKAIYCSEFPAPLYQTALAEKKILELYRVASLRAIGLVDLQESCIHSLAGLLHHILETQKTIPYHLKIPQQIQSPKEMLLDRITLSSLEVVENLHNKSQNTLLSTLDFTHTGPGKRLLRSFLLKPSLDIEEIELRLDCVDFLLSNSAKREQISSICKQIKDIERLCSKISLQKIFPKEMLFLQQSLQFCIQLILLWKSWETVASTKTLPFISTQEIEILQKKATAISELLLENPENDLDKGKYINPLCDEELKKWITIQQKGSDLLLELLETEKQQTGIPNLKMRFIANTGYFFEVNKSNLSKIPDRFIKKRSLLGSERFTTEKLLQLQEQMLVATEKSVQIEKSIFGNLVKDCQKIIPLIQKMSDFFAKIDVFNSLATVAFEKNYVRPRLCENPQLLDIVEGRHPVVENHTDFFISNDCKMNSSQFVHIITGANMSGKSTFLRQNALIILMAQIGSFVPAKSATVGLTNQIFTRIGASDNLSKGESTFLVEMSEMSHILKKATPQSFLILDEVGRGTSTYDGISISRSILEYLVSNLNLQCRTVFATHYHELSNLENLPGIKNFCFPITIDNESLIFSRKMQPGSIKKSHGIEVAKMAGLPQSIIDRSYSLLEDLEKSNDN